MPCIISWFILPSAVFVAAQLSVAAKYSAIMEFCRVPTTQSTINRARNASGRSLCQMDSLPHSSFNPSKYALLFLVIFTADEIKFKVHRFIEIE